MNAHPDPSHSRSLPARMPLVLAVCALRVEGAEPRGVPFCRVVDWIICRMVDWKSGARSKRARREAPGVRRASGALPSRMTGPKTPARTPRTAGSLRKTAETFRNTAEALGKKAGTFRKTPEAMRKKPEAFPKKAGLFRQSLGLFSPPSEAKVPKSPVFQQKRPFSSKLLSLYE